MCYNIKYVGYEQKRRKQERILFMRGGNTASKLRAGCVPRMRRDKKDMPEGTCWTCQYERTIFLPLL